MNHSISIDYEQEISVEELFKDTFHHLSFKQQRIWMVIFDFQKKYRNVFISHDKIAEIVGCCRDTVVQAFKIFYERKWIVWKKRAFRSNAYFVDASLRDLDPRNPETFRPKPTEIPTEKPTVNPTVYNEVCYINNERITKEAKTGVVHHSHDKEKLEILKKARISNPKDIWCLCRYTLKALIMAYEDLTTRIAKDPVRNIPGWFTSRCKAYS